MIEKIFLNKDFVEQIDSDYELIEDQRINHKFIMSLKIRFPDDWYIYRLYEPIKHPKKPELITYDESSKIKFLTYNKFPDGVFIRKESRFKYKVFVFELKKNATNKLPEIPMQLHSGILHAISVINFAEIDTPIGNTVTIPSNLTIDYELYVFSAKEVVIPSNPRPIPGKPVNTNTRLLSYVNEDIVYHNLKGEKYFNFKVNKIHPLEIVNNQDIKEYRSCIDIK